MALNSMTSRRKVEEYLNRDGPMETEAEWGDTALATEGRGHALEPAEGAGLPHLLLRSWPPALPGPTLLWQGAT